MTVEKREPCNNESSEAYPPAQNVVEWADIPGFRGFQASTDGRIRNRRGKIIRQRPGKNNSRRVHLGRATRMVHNLILRAFTGHPPCGSDLIAAHADDDNSNNELGNLMWANRPRKW